VAFAHSRTRLQENTFSLAPLFSFWQNKTKEICAELVYFSPQEMNTSAKKV
jgi:hypothetical protein